MEDTQFTTSCNKILTTMNADYLNLMQGQCEVTIGALCTIKKELVELLVVVFVIWSH